MHVSQLQVYTQTGMGFNPMQPSPEEANDSLYQALRLHQLHIANMQQSIAGNIQSVNEAHALWKTQATDASSVVTASTHYQNNAR